MRTMCPLNSLVAKSANDVQKIPGQVPLYASMARGDHGPVVHLCWASERGPAEGHLLGSCVLLREEQADLVVLAKLSSEPTSPSLIQMAQRRRELERPGCRTTDRQTNTSLKHPGTWTENEGAT